MIAAKKLYRKEQGYDIKTKVYIIRFLPFGSHRLLGKEFGGAYDAGQRIPENGGYGNGGTAKIDQLGRYRGVQHQLYLLLHR